MADLTKIIDLIVQGKDKAAPEMKGVNKALKNIDASGGRASKSMVGLAEKIHYVGGAFRTVHGSGNCVPRDEGAHRQQRHL